jgi:hypothetical protein
MSFLDQFATEVNFTYNRQAKYKTCCGGIVSIVVVGILTAYLVYLLQIMLKREFPDTILRTNFAEGGPPALQILYDPTYDDPNATKYQILPEEIKTKSFFYISVAFRLTNNSLAAIDPRVLQLSVRQVDLINNTFIYTDKKFAPCPRFGEFTLEEYYYLSLNQTYCINDDYTLAGFPGKEGSSYLEIKARVCRNNASCLATATVDGLIKGSKLEFYYLSNIINATSTEKVVTGTIEQTYWDVIPAFTKISTIEVGMDNLESFDGYLPDFIWGRKEYHSALVVREIATKLSDNDPNNDAIVIRISNSRISKLTERRFIDLITQVSKLGGIIGIPVMFGTIFVVLFANFDFKVNMTNVFYNLIDPTNSANVSKGFNKFLKEQYNFLMSEYEKLRLLPEKDMELKHVTPKQQKELEATEDLYENKLNYTIKFKNDSYNIFEKYFTLSKIEKMFGLTSRERLERLQEFRDRNYINDNEGKSLIANQAQEIMDNQEDERNFGSLQRCATEDNERGGIVRQQTLGLGNQRESNVEKITREKSDLVEFEKFVKGQGIVKPSAPKKKYEKDYYGYFLKKRERTLDYYKYSILYQIFKYINYDKLLLKPHEMIIKLFCGCCVKRKSLNDIKESLFKKTGSMEPETDLQKRCDILETASERMTIDFDLAYILKSVDDFEKFIIILFSEEQLAVYKSVAKPTITLSQLANKKSGLIDDLETVDSKESERDKKHMMQFEHFLDSMTHREIEDVDIKLMRIMGLSFDDAYTFGEAIKKEIRHKKILDDKQVNPDEIDPVMIRNNNIESETFDPLLDENLPDPNEQIGDNEALDKIYKQYNQ